MAQDKIVIMDGEIHRTEQTYINDIEYIRKDALLEWAKEQKTLMQLGGRVSIDDVIDKLNSM